MFDLEFTAAGVVAPETSEIKADVQALFVEAFGSGLNLDDSTPQGYLIDGITNIIAQKNANMLLLINQFNPAFASGIWQDALGNLYFLQRKSATPTIVQCVCTGLPGTVIPGLDNPNGAAQAQNGDGDIFVCTSSGTIPASGSITLQFQSAKLGEIPAPANSLNRIYRQIQGWDTINNPAAGVLGTNKESRLEYENRRKDSLALYATGSREAVYSRVFNVKNITDVIVVENDSSESVTIQGVELVRNSIYVIANGGDNTEIAEAIRNSKSGGCATNGEVSVLLPKTYVPIQFSRPQNTNVYVQVTLDVDENTPENFEELIQSAIIANFNGSDDSSGITIGQTIYASRFYCPLTALGLNIVSIKISKDNSTWRDALSFNLNQLPVTDAANITVLQNG